MNSPVGTWLKALWRHPRKRWGLLAAVALIGACGVAMAFFLPATDPLTVRGLVQAKEIKNASRFGGRVKQVWVKEGDMVQQGQPLVAFEDVEIRSKIAEARAALNQAKAREGLVAGGADPEDLRQAASQVQQAEQNLRLLTQGARPEEVSQAQAKLQEAHGRLSSAKSAYENSQQMLSEGIISQQKFNEIKSQYDTAQSAAQAAEAQVRLLKSGSRPEQLRIAKAQLNAVKAQYDKLRKGSKPGEVQIASAAIDQAQSVLDALEAQLSETVIKAPISGVVTILSVDPGELVPPNRPIVSIIDYQNLWTDLYIPENALEHVKMGQSVSVRSPVYPGRVFQGRVAFVSPKSEFVPNSSSASAPTEQSSFRVKVQVQPHDTAGQTQLHPGMKVQVSFRP